MMSKLSVEKDLVYLDGARIVLPKNDLKILPLVHFSHIGLNKSYDLWCSLYFWPRMFNDIRQMILQYRPSNVHRPSQPKNPRSTLPPSSYLGPPMSHMGLDLFEFGGKQHLICVDHWTGYPMFTQLSEPQFRGEFSRFCEQFGIKHELSAPYNPRSNGLAESGLKIIKSILVKCLGEGKDVHRMLYEWRNAPRQHVYSPAQLMFGRSQNTLLPQPPKAFSPIDLQQAARDKDKAFVDQAAAYDKDIYELSKLLPGENVRIQCEKTGSWERIGEIVEITPTSLLTWWKLKESYTSVPGIC